MSGPLLLTALLLLLGVGAPQSALTAEARRRTAQAPPPTAAAASLMSPVTTGNAFVVVNTVQFDVPMQVIDELDFRQTIATFFNFDMSRVVLSDVRPIGPVSVAVQFYGVFPDQASAQPYVDAFNNPATVQQIFSNSTRLNRNPRVVSAMTQPGRTMPMGGAGGMAMGGAGGAAMGGAGGMASGNRATPGTPGTSTPGAPGTVTYGNDQTVASGGAGGVAAGGSGGSSGGR